MVCKINNVNSPMSFICKYLNVWCLDHILQKWDEVIFSKNKVIVSKDDKTKACKNGDSLYTLKLIDFKNQIQTYIEGVVVLWTEK